MEPQETYVVGETGQAFIPNGDGAKPVWAVLELMGHDRTAGRVTREEGLWRVDVPNGASYTTEYISDKAIFRMRIVSEEIARAFVPETLEARPLDLPIVTREQYEGDMQRYRATIRRLEHQVGVLTNRLTTVETPPALTEGAFPEDYDAFEGDDDEDLEGDF